MRKNPLKRLSIVGVCLLIITFLVYIIFAFCTLQTNMFAWSEGQRFSYVVMTLICYCLFIGLVDCNKILDSVYEHFDC